MKKIKIIIIFLIVILLSGCHKEYYLYINDDKITEKFDIVLPYSEDNIERLNLNYYPLHANENQLYEKEIQKNGDMINAHFEYEYSPRNFVNTNSINQCFEDKEIIVDNEDYYYLKLGNMQNCMDDYDLSINIVTNNKVLSNNADKKRGNKYIWNLNNENKDQFNLEIKIAKGVKRVNYFLIAFAVLGIIALVFLISTVVRKSKENNRI